MYLNIKQMQTKYKIIKTIKIKNNEYKNKK